MKDECHGNGHEMASAWETVVRAKMWGSGTKGLSVQRSEVVGR